MADNHSPFADVQSERAPRSGNSGGGKGRGPIIAIAAVVIVLVIAAVVLIPRFAGTSSTATSAAPTTTAVATSAVDESQLMTVSIKIDATESSRGAVLFEGDVKVPKDGATVEDALRATNLQISSKSSLGMGTYVSGIDGVMEKEQKATSGWIFSVNGEHSSQSCDKVAVSEGDQIEWAWYLDAVNKQ
jgi:hypothetical protein